MSYVLQATVLLERTSLLKDITFQLTVRFTHCFNTFSVGIMIVHEAISCIDLATELPAIHYVY